MVRRANPEAIMKNSKSVLDKIRLSSKSLKNGITKTHCVIMIRGLPSSSINSDLSKNRMPEPNFKKTYIFTLLPENPGKYKSTVRQETSLGGLEDRL